MKLKHSSSSTPLTNAPPPGFDVYSSAPLINPPPGFDVGAATQNEGQQGSHSALSLDEQATSTTTVPTTILSPKYICYFPPLSSSTATTQPKQLAKQFLELYYAIFSSTKEEESLAIASLLPFYTPSFQKSISINGVHSVVSANIIALVQQLQYTINTIRNCGTASGGKLIDIQSVVAQDLSDSGGVLIMVAGTTTNTTTFFSHTVTLVPMRSVPIPTTSSSTIPPAPGLSEEYHNSNKSNISTTATEEIVVTGYQIYNDAFMLLSSS